MNCEKNENQLGKKKSEQWKGLLRKTPFLVCLLYFLGNCGNSQGSGQGVLALAAALGQFTSEGSDTCIPPIAEDPLADPGERYSGGYGTNCISNQSSFDVHAFNMQSSNGVLFNNGNSFFNQTWTAEGSSAAFGLGPTFNARSCQGCHSHDGRGAPPASGNLNNAIGILIRLSKDGTDPTTGGPIGLTNYGLQLNPRGLGCDPSIYDSNLDCSPTSIQGTNFTPPEGAAFVSYSNFPAPNYPSGSTTYPDGTNVILKKPTYSFTWNSLFGDPTTGPEGFHFSPRTAPMIPGLGLLEAIPESTILGWADPSDANSDGISGKANQVWDAATSTKVLGRFGWKANEPNLAQQNQGAFLGDIGITSPLFSTDNCPSAQTACLTNASSSADPEITVSLANSITFYTKMVGVPARRNVSDPNVIAGKALFTTLGCVACHKPYVQTGTVSGFPELSNQHIKPYTDLLLHDMGADLADGRQDFDANGQEWRTTPLWGLGLIKTVNGHFKLLHDGRANGVEEAILWHGGEATQARQNFQVRSASERAQLIKFLESL
ncbi:di-heme oxidoredictase family protein [Leptospira wolffii]|uniref:di-heme oxidoreductase family protein n=1 Tax=Leptospira wolffii TaxID=409998 RepID=UPI000352EE48|nr:di-heme oxidoredictase family protein [Leptospira wolffii]EPG66288.1 PF06537 family protein [Leptospira wolffii serovar Khorat str. Khorat-H2]